MQNYRLWTIKTHGETFVRLYKLLSSFALVIRLAVGKDFIAFGGVEMGWRFGGGLQALFSRYGIAMLSTRYSTCSKQNAARTVCSDGRCRTKGFANSHDCILIL